MEGDRYPLLWEILRDEFQAYFSGQKSTLQNLPEQEQERIYHLREYYLSFYNLLLESWSFVSEAAAKSNIKLGGNSAGEVFAGILQHNFSAMADQDASGDWRQLDLELFCIRVSKLAAKQSIRSRHALKLFNSRVSDLREYYSSITSDAQDTPRSPL